MDIRTSVETIPGKSVTWCAWCGNDLTPEQIAYSTRYRSKSGEQYCKLQCYRDRVASEARHHGKRCERCDKPLGKGHIRFCSHRCWNQHYNEPRRKIVTREQIERLYVFGFKSCRATARELGVSVTLLIRAMQEHGIERRERTGGWKVLSRGKSAV